MSLLCKKAIAEGRGFNTGTSYDGLMKQLKTFLVTTVGWNLLVDNGGDGTDPHFFISNKTSSTVNDDTQIFYKVGYVTADSARVRITPFYKWDGSVTFSIPGPFNNIVTYDTAEFEFQARSNTELTFIALTTLAGADAYTAIMSELDMSDSLLPNGYLTTDTVTDKVMGGTNFIATLTVSDASKFVVGGDYVLTDMSGTGFAYRTTITARDTDLNTVTVLSPNSLNITLGSGTKLGVLPRKFVFAFEYGNSRGALLPYSPLYGSLQSSIDIRTANSQFDWTVEDVFTLGSTVQIMVQPIFSRNEHSHTPATRLFYGHVPYIYMSKNRPVFTSGLTVGGVNYIQTGYYGLIEEGTLV